MEKFEKQLLYGIHILTLFGKVIIVKSLLISKFTHVLLSLPSPSTYMFKALESIFMNFIWGNKQPKFRREILELPIAKGGLCLTNLLNFDLALKITWLKRVQSQNSGWSEFAHASNIHKIVIYGDLFAEKLSISICNKFWADVAYGAHKLLEVSTPKCVSEFLNTPLWHNSRINLQYRREWADRGFLHIGDIVETHCELLPNRDMQARGLFLNFVEYFSLKQKINILNLSGRFMKTDCCGPAIPNIMIKIKGSSNIYNELCAHDDNVIQEVRNKWSNVLNIDIPLSTVGKAFRNIRIGPVSLYTKYIQFKLLHSRIVTNKKLYGMGLILSNLCPYCVIAIETLSHAILECPFVINFLRDVENWIKTLDDPHTTIGEVEKIFGTNNTENIINRVVTASIQIIYRNRQTGKRYLLSDVKRSLLYQMQLEEFRASLDNSIPEFNTIWGNLYNEFKNM